MFNNLDFVQNTLEKYGLSDRFDAAETLLYLDSWRRLGPNQRGKPCGRGWVGLRGACKRGKKSDDNTAKIKESKIELADKIRAKKGLRDRNAPKPVVEAPQIAKKDEPIVDLAKPLDKTELKSIYFRLADGDISANEMKSHWQRMKLSSTKEALKAELSKQTIAQLEREFPSYHNQKRKKAEMIDLGVRRLEDIFVPKGESTAYAIFGSRERMEESRIAAMDGAVSKWTDEKIKEQSDSRKALKAERQKALTNPETLEELRSFERMRGADKLTPEQRRKYEDLQAEENLGRRQKQEEIKATAAPVSVKKEGDVFGESKTTKHSKTGQDLHVVTMGSGDRLSKEDFSKLKDRAKTFGGYYSSFRGSGAIPGFQFKNPDDAAKFRTLDKEQRAPEQSAAVQAKKQGKLSDLADRIEEQANKTLSVERQVNTARRARMAGGVEAAANEQLKKVETIRNLAEADARGELKFLGKVSTGADIDQLNSILNRGHYEHAREVGSKTPGARMDRLYDAPRTLESIDKAKMPTSELRPRNIRSLAEAGAKIPGLKRLSEKYRKAADNSDAISEKKQSYVGVKLRPGAETAEFKAYVKKIEAMAEKNPRMKNATSYDIAEIRSIMQDTDRLQRLGITDDATLRAALREYLPHTGKKKEESPTQRAYRRERELIGGDKSIGVDFFPTPKALAEKVASRADIEEGMTVLDPSAGGGRLSDAAKEAGGKVKAIEMSSNLSSLLKDKGYDVESEDFLKVEPTGTYDRVVMNPPFSGGADMEHVQHAYKFLKPGGKLVAIMSEGPFFRGDKKATQFRSWLDGNSGESEKLPENSFKESNTGVNTRLVTITKPESSMNNRSDSGTSTYLNSSKIVQYTSAIDRLNDRYNLHLDAKKVLRKIGGRRPGKHCVGKNGGKGSYISAEKQCKGHKGTDGKLTAAGKYSATELAARVRDRKGFQEKHDVKFARRSLSEVLAPLKGAKTEAQLTPMIKKNHGEARSELNKRRIKGGRGAIVDKGQEPEYKDLNPKQRKAAKLFAEDILSNPEKRKQLGDAMGQAIGRSTQKDLSVEQRQAAMDLHGIYSTAFAIADKKRNAKPKTTTSTSTRTRTKAKTKNAETQSKAKIPTAIDPKKQSNYAMALSSIGNGFPNNPKFIKEWADKHGVVLDELVKNHGAGLTPKAAKNNSPEFLALTKAVYNDKPFTFKGKKTKNEGIRESLSKFANLDSSNATRSDSEDRQWARWDSAIDRLNDRYNLHLDAKKVLRKIGGRRPGKRCKNGWIAAERQCSDHKTKDGKLTAAGKDSARELAARVRDRKGMQDKRRVSSARMSLKEFTGDIKGGTNGKLTYDQSRANFTKMAMFAKAHSEARSELNSRRAKAGLPAIVDKESTDAIKKQLVGLDDRIESEQKARTARKTATTKAKKQTIAPSDLKIGDRRQAVQYNEQGAARAKAEGRSADAKAWEQQAKAARISEVKSRQRQVSTNQGEMFGIEEVTDLPLFRKRKDSNIIRWDSAVSRLELKYGLRLDRAIVGGKAVPKAGKKKNCSDRSHQCGSVCVPLKNKCRKGDLGNAQERLKKLRKSGADDLTVRKAKTSLVERTGGKRKEIDENRVSSLRNRVKNSTLSGVGKSEGLGEIDPYSIEVDPKRFQYKIIGEHTATGSVGSLAGVKRYDPNLAGILQVWKDPQDGKTYVVNGHNRLDLGKKLGAEAVAVRYLKAPDAKTARAIGALTNIAEGRGNALDAAKFFRDTGISKDDLSAKGIPMREKIATEGLALSKLDDSLFRRTIDGDIPMARAAIVGGSGLDAAQQRDLMKLVDKEGKKKNLTDGAIAEMVDIAKSSQTHQETTMSLFGEESVTKSNMIEKAKLQASIKQRLSREKNLFGTVSRGRAADELARGGNTIDKSKSGEISAAADQSLRMFDQMKNLSGPMSDVINKAASRMSNGESQKSVEKDLYAEISAIDIFSLSKRRAA